MKGVVVLKKKIFLSFALLASCFLFASTKIEAAAEKNVSVSKLFYAYENSSFTSKKTGTFGPQTVTVLDALENGWMKIQTYKGPMWIAPNGEKLRITKFFKSYDGTSFLSRQSGHYAPQDVTVLDGLTSGWMKIVTSRGDKWIAPNGIKQNISVPFKTYLEPSFSGKAAGSFSPQTVTVWDEQQNGWKLIQTYKGGQWTAPNGENLSVPTTFIAYTKPSLSSAKFGTFRKQSVTVVSERTDGWKEIKTYRGNAWVQPGIGTSYMKSRLLNAPIINQFPDLRNGCELVSLQMLLSYYGENIPRAELVSKMKKDPAPLVKNASGKITKWGDPSVGFVGDVTGKTPGFTIDPNALFPLLDTYLSGVNLTGSDYGVLEQNVRNGKPVVVWATVYFQIPSFTESWVAPSGKTIRASFSTHAVLMTGFDEKYVYVNDPYSGSKNMRVDKNRFIQIYNTMGKKALSVLR